MSKKEDKPKIGAPTKGLEGKQQVPISVQKKVVKLLGVEGVRIAAARAIQLVYESKLKLQAKEQETKDNFKLL